MEEDIRKDLVDYGTLQPSHEEKGFTQAWDFGEPGLFALLPSVWG